MNIAGHIGILAIGSVSISTLLRCKCYIVVTSYAVLLTFHVVIISDSLCVTRCSSHLLVS